MCVCVCVDETRRKSRLPGTPSAASVSDPSPLASGSSPAARIASVSSASGTGDRLVWTSRSRMWFAAVPCVASWFAFFFFSLSLFHPSFFSSFLLVLLCHSERPPDHQPTAKGQDGRGVQGVHEEDSLQVLYRGEGVPLRIGLFSLCCLVCVVCSSFSHFLSHSLSLSFCSRASTHTPDPSPFYQANPRKDSG